MENNNLYYQESKRINLMGMVMSYFLLTILSFALGYIYTVFTALIPIIYLNILLTVGFGLVLAIAIRLLVRISHNRNKRNQIIQALVCGLLANFFQWTAYISFAVNGEIPAPGEYLQNLYWIIVPQNFFALIAEINSIGMWSVFGVTVNGFVLALIWLIEMSIITAIPVVAMYYKKVFPYSELMNKWYPKFTLFIDFEAIAASAQLVRDLQNDAFETIKSMGKGTGIRHCKIHLFYLKEEETQYLTFENVFIDSQGKGKKESTVVINNFAINNNTAKLILDNFECKRERTNVI